MQYNKILIIGDAGVGKTTIVNRLTNGEFNPKYVGDIAVTTHIIGNFKITVFPGSFKYSFDNLIHDKEEHNIQYDRIVIMCDINSTMSFDNNCEWFKLIRGLCHKNTRIVLFINKCDVTGSEYFTKEWVVNVAKKYKAAPFISKSMTTSMGSFDSVYYASAKTNLNMYKILGDSDEPRLKCKPMAPPEVLISDVDRERINSSS
jgi:small GTP-binding protein